MTNFTFDLNGNIYIEYNNESYMIYINRDDQIDFEKINKKQVIQSNDLIESNSVKLNTDKYDKIEKKNKLQVKAIESAIEEFDTNEEFTKLKDDDDYMKQFGDYIYNPELKYYDEILENNDNETDEDYDPIIDDIDDREYNFEDNEDNQDNVKYNDKYKIKIYGDLKKSKYTFSYSNYEAILIEGDLSSTNVIFRTQHQLPSYRLTIFTKGYCILNIIGTKIITFKFSDLQIEKIQEKGIVSI